MHHSYLVVLGEKNDNNFRHMLSDTIRPLDVYNMCEKKEWMRSDTRKLIEMYKERVELWDIRCKEYRNKTKKHRSWEDIANTLTTTVEEVTRKIHNLRNQYNNELKKTLRHSDDDEVYKSKWPYFELLTFLKNRFNPCDKPKLSTGDFATNQQTTNLAANLPTQLPVPICRPDTDDNYEIFGRFVASEIRQLRFESLRKKMKRRIHEMITEISDEEERLMKAGNHVQAVALPNSTSFNYVELTNL